MNSGLLDLIVFSRSRLFMNKIFPLLSEKILVGFLEWSVHHKAAFARKA